MQPETFDLIIDRYKILKKLGYGGFGETFLAEDTRMPSQRQVVIKKLKPINQPNLDLEIIKDSFKKEATMLEKLGENYPYIPKLYEYFEEQNEFYLVEEYIEGKTLAQMCPISQEAALPILSSLLDILQYIHEKGVFHRDIKPENIIIRDLDQTPVLIDFGAVKDSMGKIKINSGSILSSKVIGTKGYMAPEQTQGIVLFSSDLYSLGRTMITALTGKLPSEIENNPLTGELDWTKHIPQLNPRLQLVLNKANKLSPELRYRTAKEMQEELNFNSELMTQVVATQSSDNILQENSKEVPTIISSPKATTIDSPNLNMNHSTPVRNPYFFNNFGKLLLGSTLIFGVILGSIFIGYQLTIKSQINAQINEAEEAYNDKRYKDCIETAEDAVTQSKRLPILGKNNLSSQANDQKDKCQLASDQESLDNAEKFQQNEDYLTAIEESNKVSSFDNNLYQEAQTILKNSVNKMLQSAAANYERNGDAEQASKTVEPLLNILSQDSQYHQQVAQKIKDWEKEEEQNKSLLDEVRAELEKEKPNWNLAYNKANEVTTRFYRDKAQPLKDQAFHGNNKDRLERAKASYNQGNLKGAINTAKQISSDANVYSDATQLLSKWRSELSKLEADIQRFLKHYFADINRGAYEAAWSHLTENYKSKQDFSEDFVPWWDDKYVYLKNLEFDTKADLLPLNLTVEYEYTDDEKENKIVNINWCLRQKRTLLWKFQFEPQSVCQ